MKYLIASDIHGGYKSAEMLTKWFEELKCDKIVLLGDYLYHGPRNGLPEDYDVIKTSDVLNKYADKIMAIRGNCDADVDQKMLNFSIEPRYIILSEGGKTIFCTHGDRYNPDRLPPVCGIDVLIAGHSHIADARQIEEGPFYCNPGSTTFPRNGARKSFMILQDSHFEWRHLDDGEVFHEENL